MVIIDGSFLVGIAAILQGTAALWRAVNEKRGAKNEAGLGLAGNRPPQQKQTCIIPTANSDNMQPIIKNGNGDR
jgi:hypothetical protein